MRARDLIDEVSWLRGLSEPARAELADAARVVQWPAGTIVCRQDDEDRDCFVVGEGSMRVTRALPDGRAVTLAHLQPPAAFGELALLRAGRRNATISAIRDSRGIALDADVVLAALQQDAAAALAVAVDLAGRLASVDERLLRYAMGTAAGGVCATLLAWVQARRDADRQTGDVEVVGGVGDVARTAGIPKKSALRFMSHLELEGTITMRGGRTVIHDLDALARYLG
jgi:CRP/FNR family transcriptional regulator